MAVMRVSGFGQKFKSQAYQRCKLRFSSIIRTHENFMWKYYLFQISRWRKLYSCRVRLNC
jgi:hypothetical protein